VGKYITNRRKTVIDENERAGRVVERRISIAKSFLKHNGNYYQKNLLERYMKNERKSIE